LPKAVYSLWTWCNPTATQTTPLTLCAGACGVPGSHSLLCQHTSSPGGGDAKESCGTCCCAGTPHSCWCWAGRVGPIGYCSRWGGARCSSKARWDRSHVAGTVQSHVTPYAYTSTGCTHKTESTAGCSLCSANGPCKGPEDMSGAGAGAASAFLVRMKRTVTVVLCDMAGRLNKLLASPCRALQRYEERSCGHHACNFGCKNMPSGNVAFYNVILGPHFSTGRWPGYLQGLLPTSLAASFHGAPSTSWSPG
jgi:hypothetical protein